MTGESAAVAAAATAAAVPTVKEAKLLGEQLQHDPVRNANNAVRLLQCLQQPLQEVRHQLGQQAWWLLLNMPWCVLTPTCPTHILLLKKSVHTWQSVSTSVC
jgi:hypothetical protein